MSAYVEPYEEFPVLKKSHQGAQRRADFSSIFYVLSTSLADVRLSCSTNSEISIRNGSGCSTANRTIHSKSASNLQYTIF